MAPSSASIRQMFEPLSIKGRQSEMFKHISDNVHWTILGHSPMSGVYNNKADFQKDTLQYLAQHVLKEPLTLNVINVIGGSDSDWAVVEMEAINAECKNGLTYDMRYCWTLQFDENDKIVKVRAYLDTKLLTDAIEQNR